MEIELSLVELEQQDAVQLPARELLGQRNFNFGGNNINISGNRNDFFFFF